ncbi:hypothetical protein HYH03_013080 [Edaphochlamys debaryana]|uniref:ABC transporter domain-containing protein n=1 Tax=Edaphochlamys debaryana TaxID=47281 RepID=A0A836BUX0_9CHLO|nr:hypothetical protein HYH03_013080 [Edaphochlamys debaryana]|eukprot:KAG2488394.1 hypothetical protein HYH03_013080 [Edaphochlamys debaryana]
MAALTDSADAGVRGALAYMGLALLPAREPGWQPTQVRADELVRFLSAEPFLNKTTAYPSTSDAAFRIEVVRSVFGARAVAPLTDVVEALSSGSRQLACPKLSAASDPRGLPRTTGPGCPCNYTANAASLRCPAGYRCSRLAYVGLSTDILVDPVWAEMQAMCIPCDAGQSCPEGLYIAPLNELQRYGRPLDCPAGYFCPTSGNITLCPAGFYCGQRVQEPSSCDYYNLMSTAAALIPVDGQSDLLTRLKKNREPIRGNYCPAGSSKPSATCPGGYYCPNVSTMIICPENNYCKPQSIYPVPCPASPAIVECPAGTSYPDGRPLAGLIFGMIIVGMYVLFWMSEFAMWAFRVISRSVSLVKRVAAGWETVAGAAVGMESANTAENRAIEEQTRRDADKTTFDVASMETRPYWQLSDHLNIRFRDVRGRMTKKQKDKGGALEGISGFFEAGKLSAIMGPSGCGKTTLLLVLSGRMPAAVSVFNEQHDKVALTETRYRRKLGFVPQDDILHPDLTVRENLEYSARLKLPLRMPRVQRHAIIEDTLRMLGMYDKQDRLTGSVENKVISGGERKRVSIGVEIVGKPPLLFMDEPTSGLDAARSSELVTLLSNLAAYSTTNIVAVVHQPRYSSFILFDKLMLLAPGGKMLFQGPPSLCVPYFRILGFKFPVEENHADTLLDIVAEPAMTSDRGIRVEELPGVWTSVGEAWMNRFNNPVERMKRAVQAMVLSNRMQKLAKSSLMQPGFSGQANNVALPSSEKRAIAGAIGDAAAPVKLLPDWREKKYKPERDALQTGSTERKRWLDNKLRKLFPKHAEEGAALERQRAALEGYERGFHSDDSSLDDVDLDDEDSDVASVASDRSGKILLLKHPNRGDKAMDEQGFHDMASGMAFNPREVWSSIKHHVIWEYVQLRWLVHRNLVKSVRAFWPGTVVDVILLLGAAFIVGAIQGSKWGLSNVPSNMVMAYLVLAVLSSVTHLRTFTLFRTVQLRERMSGISVLSTFVSSNITDLGWIFLSPAIYFSIFYYCTLLRADFSYFYIIGFLVTWWCAGFSYMISVSKIPAQAQLISTVILILILGAFLHGMDPSIRSARGTFLEVVIGLSYNRWAMEAATIQEFKKYFSYKSNEIIMIYYQLGLCKMDETLVDNGDDTAQPDEILSFVQLQQTFNADSCDRYFSQDCIILFCMGLGWRLIAFAQMAYQSHEQYFQIMREKAWKELDDLTGINTAMDWVRKRKGKLVRRIQKIYRDYLLAAATKAGKGLKSGVGAVAGAAATGARTVGSAAAAGASTVASQARSAASGFPKALPPSPFAGKSSGSASTAFASPGPSSRLASPGPSGEVGALAGSASDDATGAAASPAAPRAGAKPSRFAPSAAAQAAGGDSHV